MPKGAPKDNLTARMDQFANDLLTLAASPDKEGEQVGEKASLQDKLDVFKLVCGWVAVKNKLGDTVGDDLERFRQGVARPSRVGEASPRIDDVGPFQQSYARGPRHTDHKPANNGGSALDAIKDRLPIADAGDDAGPGVDLEC